MAQVDPLSRAAQIADQSGFPTQFFIRQWNNLLSLPALGTPGGVSTTLDQLGTAQGSLIYRDAALWTTLGPSTIGFILRTNGAAANPSWTSLSSILDLIGSTRGSIVYRGASGWAALVPGTSGYVLTSNGAGADPSYVSATAGVDIQTLLDGIGSTQGDILYRNASDWVVLAPGTSGQFLKTNGASNNPAWDTPSTGTTPVWEDMTANMAGFNLHVDGRTITGQYTASARKMIRAKNSHSTGKFYFEIVIRLVDSHFPLSGIATSASTFDNFVGSQASSYGYGCAGTAFTNNSGTGSLATLAAGDILGVAVDFTASTGSVKFYKNNSLAHTYSSLTLAAAFPATSIGGSNNGESCTIATTAALCTYSPPAGYSNWD